MRRKAVILLAVILFVACGRQSVFSLPVGTCFNDEGESTAGEEVSSVPIVDCIEPHDNEVFALIDYTETDVYPGSEAMNQIGTDLCIEQFDEYVGIGYIDSELEVFSITPSEASWNDDGDREVVCALYNLDFSKLTGSMEGAAR
jgi:Septum formation